MIGKTGQKPAPATASPRRAVLLGSLKAAAYVAPATLALLSMEARASS